MDLQNTFYLVSIIFILMCILMMGMAIYLLWKLQRSVAELKEQTVSKVQGFVEKGGSGIIGMVGMGAASFILSQLKNVFMKRRG